MSEKQVKAEQTSMDLSAVEAQSEVTEVNVFRPDDISAEQKDLIRRHQLWLSTIRKEYATGIPSVEDEINYYVRRYSNYKKCVNGRDLLIDALGRAAEKLSEKKDELQSTKEKKVAEQDMKRKELNTSLDAVSIEAPNVQSVIDKYKGVLNAY